MLSEREQSISANSQMREDPKKPQRKSSSIEEWWTPQSSPPPFPFLLLSYPTNPPNLSLQFFIYFL